MGLARIVLHYLVLSASDPRLAEVIGEEHWASSLQKGCFGGSWRW